MRGDVHNLTRDKDEGSPKIINKLTIKPELNLEVLKVNS